MNVKSDITIAGKYLLSEKVASDFFSESWRARDLRMEARSLLARICVRDREEYGIERVMRYRLALASVRPLAFPGVMRVFEVGEWEGRSFAIFEDPGEVLDACAVFDLLPPGARIAAACRFGAALAAALAFLDEYTIVHGAIRPECVAATMKAAVPAPLLHGFGLRFFDAVELERRSPAAIAIARYASPEKLGTLRRAEDGRSDLYSLGLLLHRLIAGAPPFDAVTVDAISHLQIARRPMPLSSRVGGIPPELDAIVSRLLEKEPERRYQSAVAVEADLARAAAGERGFIPGASDARPRVSYALGLSEDDTSTARSGAADAARISAVMDACSRLATITDVGLLAEEILSKAMEMMGAQRGYLFTADEETKSLGLRLARNMNEGVIPEYSRSILRKVFEDGKSLLVRDAREDLSVSAFKSVESLGLKSIVCAPLRLAGAILGVCYLDNPLSGGVFSPEDLRYLETFMALSAVAMQNSLLREKLSSKTASIRRARLSSLGENAVERVVAFLRANLTQDVERSTLERMTGLNGDHLGKIFKMHTGLSIANYVSRLRVEKAVDLLRSTDDQVIDIAFAVGFGSLNSFYRAFDQVTNSTPGSYRSRAER